MRLGFRILLVFPPFCQQLVTNPITASCQACHQYDTPQRVHPGPGGQRWQPRGYPGGYWLRVQTAAASGTKRVTLK